MEWYYAGAKGVLGPVLRSELARKRQRGEIEAETLVWCERLEDWMPYSEAIRRVAVTGESPATSLCSVCGRTFEEKELLDFGTCRVCGKCKPVYVQKLREGVAPAVRAGGNPLAVAGGVLGLLSLPAIFCGLPGILIMILGMIFSIIGYRRAAADPGMPGRGMALTGILAAAVTGLAYLILMVFLGVGVWLLFQGDPM